MNYMTLHLNNILFGRQSNHWYCSWHKKNELEYTVRKKGNLSSILNYRISNLMSYYRLNSFVDILNIPHFHQGNMRVHKLGKMRFRCKLYMGKHMTGKLLIHRRTFLKGKKNKNQFHRSRGNLQNTWYMIQLRNNTQKCNLYSLYCWHRWDSFVGRLGMYFLQSNKSLFRTEGSWLKNYRGGNFEWLCRASTRLMNSGNNHYCTVNNMLKSYRQHSQSLLLHNFRTFYLPLNKSQESKKGIMY